jgi:hypothetical protein
MESTKFKYLDDNLKLIVSKLSDNQNFVRYVMYLTNDPLALNYKDESGKLISQPNININLIDTGNVVLDDFSQEILKEEKVILFLHSSRGTFDIATSNDLFAIDITYPFTRGILKGFGRTRYNQIAYEFCRSIDMKDVGIGQVKVYDYIKGSINDKYGILTLLFKICNASVAIGK